MPTGCNTFLPDLGVVHAPKKRHPAPKSAQCEQNRIFVVDNITWQRSSFPVYKVSMERVGLVTMLVLHTTDMTDPGTLATSIVTLAGEKTNVELSNPHLKAISDWAEWTND
jgi:hypothetical protein